MKIAPDTNLLVRLIMGDDEAQQRLGVEALEGAELVAIGVHCLCELAWVLHRSYGVAHADVSVAIRGILGMRNVVASHAPIEAGLAMLEAGGDFADGVIAFEGRWLGGETFVSFDRKAVKASKTGGHAALLLG